MTSGSSCSSSSSTAEQEQQHSCCISHHFFKAASQNLHKIAVIHASPSPSPSPPLPGNPASSTRPPVYEGDRCFTFGHVLNSVDSLASVLPAAPPQSAASKFPRIIGIYMPPSVEYIVSVLSVLRCGHAFLPLDPSWPTHRVLSLLHSSTPDLIIASPSLPLGFGCPCPVLPFSMEEAGCRGGDGGGVSVWPCEREPKRSFCYLMYTSGSTGNPKAVCGTELGLLNRFLWMQDSYPLRGEEVLLFKTAISFVDHLQEFLAAMLAACTLVIPPFHKLKASPFAVIHFLQAYSINRLTAVPSLMRTILPALQHQCAEQIRSSLKLLILSGEVFPISLWDALSNLLPTTTILNLYGSTEVSGDCTYFDCIRLPMILETEALTSVPIGVPISHCDVVLVSENGMPNEGEIHVGGLCVSEGYFDEAAVMSFDFVHVYKNSLPGTSVAVHGNQLYYRTGDLAQRLQSGDLVFLGRMDRTIKVNGQRVALEEIETTLKGHPDVVDAAVISREGPEGLLLLDSFLMLKEKDISIDLVRRSIRRWMIGKVPLAMVPNRFLFTASLPVSSSGKVDYALLASPAFLTSHAPDGIGDRSTKGLLEDIKMAFCDALMVEVVSVEDDFFMMGGNSITAAHVAYNLGIDMRVLYKFPTPSELFTALRDKTESCHATVKTDGGREWKLKADDQSVSHSADSSASNLQSYQSWKQQLESPDEKNLSSAVLSKHPRVDLNKYIWKKRMIANDKHPWSSSTLKMCSFGRCNKVVYGTSYGLSSTCPLDWSAEVPGNGQGSSMQELWKVLLDSCVDASPLVVFKEQDVYLFIGSHAQKFVCVNAKSGSVHWEVKLEGRIECSAAVVADFSQVVVGCYKGKIYFLNFSDGTICWTFQTSGEVKSQPVLDIHKQLF
ncbi:hypothetical protein Tsubulata_011272 [Turnera subulata]|uniref:Carrier domain-containing protein n=1 Tax=Turnera subulata TaxID=218843 RepID=A0A9Q0JCY0_9ROSI|nr:hypothetical protein Tsubulata_011272 [Turnera subulata]